MPGSLVPSVQKINKIVKAPRWDAVIMSLSVKIDIARIPEVAFHRAKFPPDVLR
jgi:hypothetical protein